MIFVTEQTGGPLGLCQLYPSFSSVQEGWGAGEVAVCTAEPPVSIEQRAIRPMSPRCARRTLTGSF
ncbi:MAG TPA: hypothetical protein VEZ89_15390, partial [Rubrivivax sp.]|nr:hypothetical protein [Rubrivivax sp.]